MKRREFSRDVRAEIIRRATNAAGQVCCEGCGYVGLKKHKYQVDHTTPTQILLEKRKLTAADGKVLCLLCHKEKTGEDVARITKAKAQEASRMGLKAPSKTIQGRGFAPKPETKPSKPERTDTVKGMPRLPPRSLFR